MDRIEVHLKSGQVIDYRERGRPGGSYTIRAKYEGAFLVIVDEWGKEEAFPAADIEKVIQHPGRW